MQASKMSKRTLKYLPFLVVIAVAVIGVFVSKDLYRQSLDTREEATVQLLTEQNRPQLLFFSEATGTCFSPDIYTSLPPKCRTSEGKFIQVPGTSSAFVVPK